MVCSQIFDNGTSVGVSTTGSFAYTNSTSPPFSGGTVPMSGTVKFDVNGIIRTVGIFATSDRKFKKDISPIENSLEKVLALEGKTYKWNQQSNSEKNFDNDNHSGFIAQDIEKVLPHLVITGENGEKAVNYLELIPYLVEAIKAQESKIAELQNQISENFKSQNQELINMGNTKIISISPNPSTDKITIALNIDKSVQQAKLFVHDINGNVMASFQVNERENNINKTLQKDNFGRGIYIVSLVVNGKSIDSKKIVFN